MTEPIARRNQKSTRVQVDPGGETRTHQSDADACDINKVMKRWRKQGFHTQPPHLNPRTPVYGDFSSGMDFLAASEAVLRAKEKFDALPARLRRACNNDPAQLQEFIDDEENAELLRDMGILPLTASGEARAEPSPSETPATTEEETSE